MLKVSPHGATGQQPALTCGQQRHQDHEEEQCDYTKRNPKFQTAATSSCFQRVLAWLCMTKNQLTESETVSIFSDMACTISHDIRHSLSTIYANAEFLERPDISAHVRADLVREIQEVVLEMNERPDSLLQFACSGRRKPLAQKRVSTIVEKAIAAVKSHPSGRNVSIRVGKFPLAEADIDAMNLQSVIYNLLLYACQAATRSVDMPVVEVFLVEVEQWLYITILDNGPGIPASVRETLFDPFVTMGKPNGTGLGLTLARRIA